MPWIIVGAVIVRGEVALTPVKMYCLFATVLEIVLEKLKATCASLFIHVVFARSLYSFVNPKIVRMIPFASESIPVWLKTTAYCVS